MSRRSVLMSSFFVEPAGGGPPPPSVDAIHLLNADPVFATDYLQLTAAFPYNASYTAAGWFKADFNAARTAWVIAINSAADTTNLDALIVDDGTGLLVISSKAADTDLVDFTAPAGTELVAGTWYYLALVRSGNTIGVFKNSTLLGSMQASNATGRTAATALALGNIMGGSQSASGVSFCGWNFWTRALSAGQLAAQQGFVAPQDSTSIWAAYPLAGIASLSDSTATRADMVFNGDEDETVPGPSGVV